MMAEIAPGQEQGLVLVIDDDPAARQAVRTDLEAAGFDVVAAVDAEAGLQLAALRGPDAVLLDLELPDQLGLDVLPQLRRRLADEGIPVLVFTRDDDVEVLRAAFAAGAHDHLGKPWITEVLVARVRAAVRLGAALRAAQDANLRLQRASEVDELTGLSNRRALSALLDRAVGAAGRGGPPFAIVLLRLDGLAAVTERDGPAARDQLLVDVAFGLTSVSRDHEDLGRWSEDEFLAIISGAGPTEVAVVAERLRSASDTAVGASAGHASWAPGDDAAAVLERAEAALAVAG